MKNVDISINDRVTTTIRELKPDQYYIRVSLWRRHGPRHAHQIVRKRSDDPFISETLFGSKVASFPSDKVHPCEVTEQVKVGR